MSLESENGIVPEPRGLCATIDKIHRAICHGEKHDALNLLDELKGEAIDLRTWGEEWKKKTINNT